MPFAVNEWEIWHTYTTYLNSGDIDLSKGSELLVESGVALLTMKNDGETFWKTENGLAKGAATLISSEEGRSFELRPKAPANGLPTDFVLEAWGQAASFLLAELSVLGQETELSEPYLRAYLGKFVVTKLGREGAPPSSASLYPILLIYESGIITLEFRVIGPPFSIDFETFVDGGVNLFREFFDRIEVNPGLARNATAAYYRSRKLNLLERARFVWRQKGHDLAVKQRTKIIEDKDFKFELSPWSGDPSDLKAIALTIFNTAAFLLLSPKWGLSFVLLGQNKLPNLGEFWSGRPHVHLIKFHGQRDTATENAEQHRVGFWAILTRSAVTKTKKLGPLPPDSRLFEDYNAYVTSALSLWVWSKRGLQDQRELRDPNRGNFIYERQVLMEVLEYGYMLHRALYHSVEKLRATSEVMSVRKKILRLRLRMREASHSGEIRELLENGWKEMGLPTLADEIDRDLSLRESELRSSEMAHATRVGWVIASIFGFAAVPSLADQLVIPAWTLLRVHPVTDSLKAKVIADGLALVVVLIFLSLALTFTYMRRVRST